MRQKQGLDESAGLSTGSRQETRRVGWAGQLGIGTKISLGYAIALGVATLGTVAGIVLGDHYQQQAIHLNEHAQTELQLLNQLQTSVLQARTHQQQLIPLLTNPQGLQAEYGHFLTHAAEIEQVWQEIEHFAEHDEYYLSLHSAHSDTLSEFFAAHDGAAENYLQDLDRLLSDLDPLHLEPTAIGAAQSRLLSFTNSPVAIAFDAISDELTDIIQVSQSEQRTAADELARAEMLRREIIAGSMLLSIAIATLLALLTSRAITHPLRAVTQVAQQVIQESDLERQVPVTTADEVGALASSFNQLIFRVKQLLDEKQAEASRQMIQSEKMSSLGRMIAGVAHEINNPINFIYGNLKYTNDYVSDLLDLLHLYQAELVNPSSRIQTKTEEIELDFLEEDLPKTLQSMQIGADRARQIILSLKNFSRLDEDTLHSVDLHACIESTLLILNNRIKRGITVIRNYGDIPTVEGYAGALYQVFMNLLSNAIEALEEQLEAHNGQANEQHNGQQITISTQRDQSNQVLIEIADNGWGIAAEHQAKIFDAFYTTKPRGIGTGLGLSISRQIVEDKHQGSLSFASEVGKGTVFSIRLPIAQTSSANSPVVISDSSSKQLEPLIG